MQTLVAAAVLVAMGASAAAQDRGPLGIAMGYPSVVSVIWHATERVAVLPRISFSRNSTESVVESTLTVNGIVVSTTHLTTTTEGWSVGPGVDVRFSVADWDTVSAYVVPGYSYFRGSSTAVSTSDNPFTGNQTDTRRFTSDGHELRGAFGVQYRPHRKFAVYGEVGLRYSESRSRSINTSDNRVFGNASALGAILYF
jgi:hypothetical protein